jgi:DNA-binding CsgD family transcriptional regulator
VAALGRGIPLQALGQLAVDEGDHGEGRRLFEEAREVARAQSEKGAMANALYELGQLARAEADPERAAALHDEALELRHQIGELPRMVDSFEAIAGLTADAGNHGHAARLLGAAQALRDRGGYARPPWESARYEADMALVSRSLPAEELKRAFAEGQALSLADAVAEASLAPVRMRPADGWPTLTQRQQEVAQLVAEGLTNPEIAERLVITRETVKTHLSNIFSKLGIAGRWELAREVRYRTGRSR